MSPYEGHLIDVALQLRERVTDLAYERHELERLVRDLAAVRHDVHAYWPLAERARAWIAEHPETT